MTVTAIVGTTGFTGSNILAHLLANNEISSITAFCRKEPPVADPEVEIITSASMVNPKLNLHINSDSTEWPAAITALTPPPEILFSALANSLRVAGTFEAQRSIEYDLNLAIAKAAKEAGVRVFVSISSWGAEPDSKYAYLRMKREFEDAVAALDFECAVFLRPFFITGKRSKPLKFDKTVQIFVKVMRKLSGGTLTNFWTSDVQTMAAAAVNAGLAACKGEAPGKLWILEGRDIRLLGKPSPME